MLTLLPERIQARLDDLGMSAREASIRATGKPDLVRFILSGKQNDTRFDRELAIALQFRARTRHSGKAVNFPQICSGKTSAHR